jgi:hypothetical protein
MTTKEKISKILLLAVEKSGKTINKISKEIGIEYRLLYSIIYGTDRGYSIDNLDKIEKYFEIEFNITFKKSKK